MHNFGIKPLFRAARPDRTIRMRAALTIIAALALWAGNCRAANIMEFGFPIVATGPEHIVYGPDGNYWWVGANVAVVGKFTPDGKIYNWAVPSYQTTRLFGATVGADGNIWVTEVFSGDVYNPGGNKICRVIIPTNGPPNTKPLMTEFNIEAPGSHPGASGITSGPDGNLWVLEPTIGGVAVMSTNGTLVKEFGVPQPGTSLLNNIITGPDGNLWFTDSNNGLIEAMTTNGAVAALYLQSNSTPFDIMVGHDNAIWFTEYQTNRIGRVTTDIFPPESFAPVTNRYSKYVNNNYNAAALTEFELPRTTTVNTYPFGIAAGQDGNIYFTEWIDAKVGRFTPVVTSSNVTITNLYEYTCPTTNCTPRFIAAGGDGKVWFGEYAGNILGQLTTTLPSIYIQQTGTNQVNLTWNTNRGFALQYEKLGAGPNGWVTSQTIPTRTNGMFSITQTIVTNRIFRLHGTY